jgi:hypothetical protein
MRLVSIALSSAAVTAALVLTACNAPQDEQAGSAVENAATPSATPASDTTGMNTALTGNQVKVGLTLQGQPILSVDGQTITVNVDLGNGGTVTLASNGSYPVNLGAHSVDAAGKIVSHDLARAALPEAIPPNGHAVVSIKLPVESSLGYSVQILPVQEGVAWFDSFGVSPLTVGPFKPCGADVQAKVCGADGSALGSN